jgi:NAD(P)-dependent dehydrogenase (short-subunit alcohol dehydrogenase family)
MDVKGKNVLITGVSSGIGRAVAVMLARAGAAKIVLIDIDAKGLESVSGEVAAGGATPIAKVADLSRPEEVIRVFEEADRETGGLDIVHNNAGIMTGLPDFPDTVMEMMIAVIQINLIAMMVGTRIAVEQMRKRGAPGVIINTSSIAAFGAMPADPAYSASKHGILAFSQSCKPLHERFDIRVMAICPGIVDTAIVPKDAEWLAPALAAVKMLQPDDIARAVLEIIADDTLAGDQVTVSNQPATATPGS